MVTIITGNDSNPG